VPEISVPALVSSLKTPDPGVRLFSANALAQFGPQAFAAVPALTNALADPDTHVRKQAANALNQIDPLTFPSPYGR
jgi:HEAT repeat protein